MTSLFVFKLRKDVYEGLMSQAPFPRFTASQSFRKKQFIKALVNPSVTVLFLCTSKREVVKLPIDQERFLVNSSTILGLS